MVLIGDFEIQLVEATSKMPYKEHNKNGKTYFEVEPKAEYYIGFKKVRNSSYYTNAENLSLSFDIDGQRLGWCQPFGNHEIDQNYRYYGLLENNNGGYSFRALCFIKPEITNSSTANHNNAGTSGTKTDDSMLGRVRFVVEEQGALLGHEAATTATMEARAVASTTEDMAKAKFVRSGTGTSSVTTSFSEVKHSSGRTLQDVELYYGTVPGLMQAGVVQRPQNVFDAYLAMNPHKRRSNPSPKYNIKPQKIRRKNTIQVNGREVVANETVQYLYDLTKLPSSDDEEE